MPHSPQTLRVALASRSYDIAIGHGLLARAGEYLAPLLPSPRVVVLSDTTVAAHYAEALEASLRAQGITSQRITVPAGEGSKSFATFESLMEQLLALAPDRKTTLIALGGGVVGDLTGFAASVLLRGVPFIQVPTSLLAQVDSSVGGKTAINARAGKNLIGTFYQPRAVLADTATLATLPPRELRAGYAEILKYGLIMDADFYRWCQGHGASILAGDEAAQAEAIYRSCAFKAAIVAADEHEADARALLNFGHTFGHALEAETGYSATLLHGEAVAIGMVMACRLSAAMGGLGADMAAEVAAHLRALGMPASLADIDHPWTVEGIVRHFSTDKKAEGGTLTFIVLDAIGHGRVAKQVDPALARAVVAEMVGEAKR